MSDVSVMDEGTLVGITPLSDEARAWVKEHVQSEPWQWLGPTLWADHRMAQSLLNGMEADGLELVEHGA